MEIQARRREIRKRNAPESEMDALFREQQAFEEKLLKSGPHGSAVGAFEGGNYQARGLYRSQADCIMFTRNRVGFCAACRRANQADHRSVFEMMATRHRDAVSRRLARPAE